MSGAADSTKWLWLTKQNSTEENPRATLCEKVDACAENTKIDRIYHLCLALRPVLRGEPYHLLHELCAQSEGQQRTLMKRSRLGTVGRVDMLWSVFWRSAIVVSKN